MNFSPTGQTTVRPWSDGGLTGRGYKYPSILKFGSNFTPMKLIFSNISALFAALVIVILMNASCANIISPNGGPRDSLPPRLVFALPKDSSVKITPKEITLNFNEYVTLFNVNENLIISPTLKNNPIADYKLKVVTLKIKDSLDPNTTYSINFGNAIRDVNEGNIIQDFTYVFATGSHLDSFTYKGKVLIAETGKVDSTLLVILHQNLADSAITKERPRYYTKINGKGEFVFNNLPSGTFRAYVLPNDFTRKYDDSTKPFAFASNPVMVSSNTLADTFYVFQEFKRIEKVKKAIGTSIKKEDKSVKFKTDIENGAQDLLGDLHITFNKKLHSFDSTQILFCDTNYKAISGYSLALDTAKTQLTVRYPWKELSYFKIVLNKTAVVDTGGNSLAKADTINFRTKPESDYGSIKIRFNHLSLAKNPVLQFIQSDAIVESYPLNNIEFNRKLFREGGYELRILYDTNQNNRWDPGSFGKIKKQPEIVHRIPELFNVKGNWDNELIINL